MADHPILFVGEAPGRRQSGWTKRRLDELAGRPIEEWSDWVNLLDEWPGSGGKGSAWNASAAKRRVATVPFIEYDRVILLGRRVAGAVLPAGAGLPWFRWIERDGRSFAVMPHPSGIVRWWNEPENVERARSFLATLASQAVAV